MPVVTRDEVYRIDDEDVVMHHIGGDTFEYPAKVESLDFTGTYSPFFEAYTPNSDRSRNWKDFEHFKTVQNPLKSVPGKITLYSESVGYYPNHHSIGVSSHPFVGYIRQHPFGYVLPFGDPGRLDDGLPPFYDVQADGHFVPSPSNLSQLEQRALYSMLPLIKAELSLPNFLLEMKDFKGTIKGIQRLLTSPAFLKVVKDLAIGKNLSFKALSKKAAGHYLNYMFNWRPLVSDIGKIHNAMTRSLRRLNDFVTNQGKVQRRHFSFRWQEYPDVSGTQSWLHYPSWQLPWVISTCGAQRNVQYSPSVFHAQIEYNYNYTQYQVEHARLLGTLDALGVNLNPAIIWNAIPWSFVVDWVLGVSQYLDTLKVENMRPLINIRKYLWSIQRKRFISCFRGIRNYYAENGFWVPMATVAQTSYRRQVSMPSSSSIISSGLSSQEFSLGAALVVTRRR